MHSIVWLIEAKRKTLITRPQYVSEYLHGAHGILEASMGFR